jgi:hypothetical protein
MGEKTGAGAAAKHGFNPAYLDARVAGIGTN